MTHHDTIIEYMYRDAGNYKFYGTFCLSGSLTKKEIEQYLINGEYFIPTEVGLNSLVPSHMNSDDHMLHEFISFTGSAVDDCLMDTTDFISLVKTAHKAGWFR